MYINGLGVNVDYDEALKWCKAGAEEGNVHGEYILVLCMKMVIEWKRT